jgi:uncharacterized phage protein (TIGR02218 family)
MTLAHMLRLQLTNGSTLYYTDLDLDLEFDGHVYKALRGFDMSAVQQQIGTSPSNCQFTILMHENEITRSILESGGLDNADVWIYTLNYNLPGNLVRPFVLFRGLVKYVTYNDDLSATFEAEPLMNVDAMIAVDICSASCRYDLGDEDCNRDGKTNLDDMKGDFTVASVTNRQKFTITGGLVGGVAANGLIGFETGANAGIALEIGTLDAGTITLKLITPFPLQVGDTGTIYPGCSKALKDDEGGCKFYDNRVNFGGEPYTPTAVGKPIPVPVTTPPPPVTVPPVVVQPPRQYPGVGPTIIR